MATLSYDLRRRIVDYYHNQENSTYREVARVFSVGYATVSRLLRRLRETGDVVVKPRGGNNPRRVDLEWLRKHAEEYPDVRIRDRVEAYEQIRGKKISMGAMHNALIFLGFSHKKKAFLPLSATKKKLRLSAKNFKKNKRH